MKLTYFLLGALCGSFFIYIALTAAGWNEPMPLPKAAQDQTCTVTGNGSVKYVACQK